jgi:hypothetical protein
MFNQHRQLRIPIALMAAMMVLASGPLAQSARADGDPASDVLATQSVFLPQDANVPLAEQAQLTTLLQAADRSGYQLRVAVIASPADLGSVNELWRQPADYTKFLGQELSLIYRGDLLVVMPNGYGLYRAAGPLGAQQAALAGAAPPGNRPGAWTLAAIQRLAAAAGYRLELPTATAPSGSGSTDVLPWIVFALGSGLIALAWAASLRARPLHAPRP